MSAIHSEYPDALSINDFDRVTERVGERMLFAIPSTYATYEYVVQSPLEGALISSGNGEPAILEVRVPPDTPRHVTQARITFKLATPGDQWAGRWWKATKIIIIIHP